VSGIPFGERKNMLDDDEEKYKVKGTRWGIVIIVSALAIAAIIKLILNRII
jgi:hypothetical protein